MSSQKRVIIQLQETVTKQQVSGMARIQTILKLTNELEETKTQLAKSTEYVDELEERLAESEAHALTLEGTLNGLVDETVRLHVADIERQLEERISELKDVTKRYRAKTEEASRMHMECAMRDANITKLTQEKHRVEFNFGKDMAKVVASHKTEMNLLEKNHVSQIKDLSDVLKVNCREYNLLEDQFKLNKQLLKTQKKRNRKEIKDLQKKYDAQGLELIKLQNIIDDSKEAHVTEIQHINGEYKKSLDDMKTQHDNTRDARVEGLQYELNAHKSRLAKIESKQKSIAATHKEQLETIKAKNKALADRQKESVIALADKQKEPVIAQPDCKLDEYLCKHFAHLFVAGEELLTFWMPIFQRSGVVHEPFIPIMHPNGAILNVNVLEFVIMFSPLGRCDFIQALIDTYKCSVRCHHVKDATTSIIFESLNNSKSLETTTKCIESIFTTQSFFSFGLP
mgnify:CR=1 FL=1